MNVRDHVYDRDHGRGVRSYVHVPNRDCGYDHHAYDHDGDHICDRDYVSDHSGHDHDHSPPRHHRDGGGHRSNDDDGDGHLHRRHVHGTETFQ